MSIQKVVLVFAVLFCTNSYANIYKCTDAKGNITYSSSECKSKGSHSSDVSEKVAKATKTSPTDQSANAELPKKVPPSSNQQQNYHCDGRTRCPQMTSCEEAMFFLKNCPNVEMDGGKKDGIPCEKQWCSHLVPNKKLD